MNWSNIVVNIGTIMGGLIILLTVIYKLWDKNQRQMIEVVNVNMTNAVNSFNEKIQDIKDDFIYLRELHEDHYEFQRKQIEESAEIRANLNNVIKNLDKLHDEHQRNHNSNGKYNG